MIRKVAILSHAFRFPQTDTRSFSQDLLAGKDLVTQVAPERWALSRYQHFDKTQPGTSYTFRAGSLGDISGFDAGFFGISPREASQMDPQQRLLLELSWEAFENAGIAPSRLRGAACGVYIGISSADYSYRLAEDLSVMDSTVATGNTASIAANRLSYFYDLRGPSMAIDTACSSATVAFHQACQAIRSGEITHALTGGVSLHTHPYGFIIFSKASMLSSAGRCNVFDAKGDGYVRSEGGGIFLLKDYALALQDGDDILAVVAHTAVNTDGKKSGLTVPSADAQAQLLARAYRDAKIHPDHISYFEAHGTGTAIGDPIETRALGQALGQVRAAQRPLPIGSVKSNIGHLEAASGVAGLAKALQVITTRKIPPTIGITTLNPNIDFNGLNLDVVQEPRALPDDAPIIVGVNSFGFGGANAHVILREPEKKIEKPAAPVQPSAMSLPFFLSAATPAALRDTAASLLLRNDNAAQRYSLAHHLYQAREHFEHRAVFYYDPSSANSDSQFNSLREQLGTLAAGGEHPAACVSNLVPDAKGPVFVFSGNGSQWLGMGCALIEHPIFASALKEIDALFEPLAGLSIQDQVIAAREDDPNAAHRFTHTALAQPALFAVQVGVVKILASLGIYPQAVMGHSVGEVAAAWAGGHLSLAAAVQVIFHRSRLQETTKGQGQMTAVALDLEAMQALLVEYKLHKQVLIAGDNSRKGVTLAGNTIALTRVEAALTSRRIGFRRLELDYAFHSPAMDPIKEQLIWALRNISGTSDAQPTLPFYSGVSGDRIDGQSPGVRLDADYWWNNIRQPVLFRSAVKAMLEDGFNIFLEIGPHPILQNYLKDALEARPGLISATLSRQSADVDSVLRAASQCVVAGGLPDWRAHFAHKPAYSVRELDLPNYPWQKEHHWHTTSAESANTLMRPLVHPLLGYRADNHDWLWEQKLDPTVCTYLKDHAIGGGVVLPGAAYAEIALAAARQWQQALAAKDAAKASTCLRLNDLDILSPILFGSDRLGERYQTRVVRTQLDASDGTVRISSRALLSYEPWTLNAFCRVVTQARMLTESDNTTVIPTPTLHPDFNSDTHNSLTKRVGLNYGSSFALIKQGWSVGDHRNPQVLAYFALDDKSTLDLSTHLLHPAVLDCSFQLIIQLLREHTDFSEGIAFVPTQLGTLHFDTEAGQPHSARATLVRHLPHSLVVDFSLCDAAGRLVCEVTNARFKRIRLQQATKRPIERLVEILIPAPKYPALTPSRVDFTSLAKAATQFELRIKQDPALRLFVQELDPLLDTLCARLAYEFLNDSSMAKERQACSAEYLALLTELAIESNEDAEASARDIWSTLVRDYPDFSQTIRYVGQLGQAPAAVNALPQAHFSGEWLGNTGLSQFVRLVSQQVTAAQAQLRSHDRFSVLVCGAGDVRLASHLSISLDTTALDIEIGSTVFSSASLSTESAPDSSADLVIFWANGSTQSEQDEALQQALRSMKPGATLLLLGQHPSQWMRFAFGQFDLQPRSRTRWMATLASLGLEEITPSARSDDLLTGPFVLVGRKPALANMQLNLPPRTAARADTPRSWLIIAHDELAQTKLADQWTRLLQEQGDIGSVVVLPIHAKSGFEPAATARSATAATTAATNAASGATVTAIEAAFAQSQAQFGTLDKIVYLGGVCLAADVSTITESCLTLVSTLKACEAQAVDATMWCLTTNANDRTKAVSGAAALQGFTRSVLNESAAGRLRMLDAVLVDPTNLFQQEALVRALVQECTDPSLDEEVILTESDGRYVSRTQVETDTRKQNTLTQPELYCALEFAQPGQLRNLHWVAAERPNLNFDEIEVAVDATGLNFRDVMYTLGLLSDEAIEQGFAGPTLGLEFAGRVTRVGEAVTHLSVGDRVVGFGPSCFANYVVTAAAAATRIPRALSNKSAVTIPSTFLTSYYALHHLAKLSEGERVLIHGAAGGVGLAAIQIARWCGAEVFATAGSEEKRNYLRMLGVPHVLDSRTLDYADDIMRLTDGTGVDVVLNSLSGEAITRNLSVLKPFGRFLELGKRDFYENTRIGLRPFRQNISYFGIDADQLLKHRPALTQQLFSEVMDLFEDETLSPLPYTRFEAHEIIDAFRFMQQSKQIGKVVVTYGMGIECQNTSTKAKSLALSAGGTYVVTGGMRGFGLRTARWLVDKGARQILLLGRSGVAADDLEAKDTIQAMRATGASVELVQCDVTNRVQLEEALGTRNIKGVIHAAAVIEDGLAFNLTAETLNKVLAPKILGAQHLHDLSSRWNLDFFVLYSSATTFFGNPGQAAYVAANRWLEALADARAEAGHPVTCVRWGAIEDAGFLARNTQIKQALSQRMGGAALPAELALQYLEQAIVAGTPNLGVLELEWGALRKFLPNASSPRFTALAQRAGDAADQIEQTTDIAALVRDLDDQALTVSFTVIIQSELGQILRLDPEKIPATKSVYDLGLDSLMGVELITALEARFGVRLPVMAISEDATIERLALRLIGLLRKDQQTDPTVQAIEDIAAQHAADTSPEEVEALARSLDSSVTQTVDITGGQSPNQFSQNVDITSGQSPNQSLTQADIEPIKQGSQRSLLP